MDFAEEIFARQIVESKIRFDQVEIIPDERFHSLTQVKLLTKSGSLVYGQQAHKELKTACELYYYHLVQENRVVRPEKLLVDRANLKLELRQFSLSQI